MDTRNILPKQLTSRLAWVVGMILLGSLDVFLNICNVIYFSKAGLIRCLVIGPPTQPLWILQVTFTIISVILFAGETLNTVSVFRTDGHDTYLPIHLELLITLPLEHIPLAAINYFTARCRWQYATPLQTTLGIVRLTFVWVRSTWYAHLEGKKLKKNDKYKIKRAFFMLVCALIGCTMVFPIMLWRDQNNIQLKQVDMKNVSLYFINLPNSIQHERLMRENVDEFVEIGHPALVDSILSIWKVAPYGYNVSYLCNQNQNQTKFLPKECLTSTNATLPPTHLAFQFVYNKRAPVCSLGEILYNYATVYANTTCVPSNKDIHQSWKLAYYYTVRQSHQGVNHVNLTSPWYQTCVTPVPWYDPSINVCS